MVSNIHGRRLAKKLIILIILFSSFITLIVSAIQLYGEYHRDIANIDTRLELVKVSYLQGISEAAWVADAKQLQIMLDGIKDLPDIEFVEVRLNNNRLIKSGTKKPENTVRTSIPLQHNYRKQNLTIGVFEVHASLTGVYQRLLKRVWIILVSNGIKTFLVALFIYALFNKLVTRHINQIADAVQTQDLDSYKYKKLELNRKNNHKRKIDELDTLVNAINNMQYKLSHTLETLEKKVNERTKTLRGFSYTVSHDLRSPLRGIDGYSQMLLEENSDQLDESGKEYLQRIIVNCNRMSTLIDTLLNLSQVSSIELNIEKIDLSKIASSIIESFKSNQAVPERYVKAIIRKEIYVNADLSLLKVLLENLLGNAWKYTQYKKQSIIEVKIESQNNKDIVVIQDNGVGFDMQYADQLFVAFKRLHGNEFEGTGIGLATVHQIVEKHGGKIWAEASTGKGAAFYFYLR